VSFYFDLSAPIASPAKINLGLRVLGRRADGYHDIESIFLSVDLCDEIRIEPSPEFSVECYPPATEAIEDNLVYKAASRLMQELGRPERTPKITLTKRIPSGAGLGGGSGNAATTLLALYQFLTDKSPFMDGHDAEPRRFLIDLAESLGSDVPFFLFNGLAYVTGRGDIIQPVDIPIPWWIVIVVPDVHIATAEAYSTLGITDRRPQAHLDIQLTQVIDNREVPIDLLHNDFAKPLHTLYPVFSTVTDILLENGAIAASMSGSGSAHYGLFTSVETAEGACSVLADHHTYICRPLPPYRHRT
jgi:4-diphosphocytidyl-2-C-methyl-D-erythritol kinase